jgi:hypothetical protein
MDNYKIYHGIALVRLIQDGKPASIKLFTGNNGYLINGMIYLHIKHCRKRLTPWGFTFAPEHIKELEEVKKSVNDIFIVLVCGEDGICCLSFPELTKIMFVGDNEKSKWVTVARSPREKYAVTGSDGQLTYKIGDTDFPKKLFNKSQ